MSRRAGAVEYLVEHVGALRFWPHGVRRRVFGLAHLRNQDRFIVVVFLLTNRIPPNRVLGVLQDLGHRFDSSAVAQIAWVVRSFPHKPWTAWDVAAGRSSIVERN